MVEQNPSPISTANASQDASEPVQNHMPGYGFVRPSFSYINATNMSAGSSLQLSSSPNVRPDWIQETNATPSSPAFPVPAAQHPHANSITWTSPGPPYQAPIGMLRTPVPGMPYNHPPHVQHHMVPPYVLPPQQISGLPRPPFSPYASVNPNPYYAPNRGFSPHSVQLPDIQPPGVSAAMSAIVELPPGIDNEKNHANNAQPEDEASRREQPDTWTAHWTGTGTVYYYNALTRESTYEKPAAFKGEPIKAIIQPIPISWDKIVGTDWTLVTTNDGKRYYHNAKTQVSSWQIPNEVREKQESDALKSQSVSITNTNNLTEKAAGPTILSAPAAITGGRDAMVFRPPSSASSALDLIKKKLQESGTTVNNHNDTKDANMESNGSNLNEATLNEIGKDKPKDYNGGGDVSDSSSDSEEEEKGPTKEECVIQFKEMLKERGVAPFSKWEKELPKFVFDPRFKAIPSHSARRALFDHHVRTRAEEERKEKRAAQKAAIEDFKQLLEEAKEDIDHNTDYQTFKKKWVDDPRFQALDRKDREFLLNERILPLKKAAQERAQAERAASTSLFKSMLQEKGDISSSSRWSKIKDSLKSDPRYKSVKHEDREKLFNDYVAELKAAEEEIERKAKEKQDEEDKLKERERALRKRKEREEQEVERVRVKARRKEAVESYQALLVEIIKDPQASWTESKAKLDKDPQGRSANPHLDKYDIEKHFRDHVKSLYERCVADFRALLREVITGEAAARGTKDGKTVIDSWSTAKQLLKSDPRYNKMPRKDRESLWRRHAEDIQRKQKLSNDQESEKKDSEPKSRRTHDRR